jgi:ornithine cyclodeaminase/alanine dehydrogenase-like protein (mu-crystallin family)
LLLRPRGSVKNAVRAKNFFVFSWKIPGKFPIFVPAKLKSITISKTQNEKSNRQTMHFQSSGDAVEDIASGYVLFTVATQTV